MVFCGEFKVGEIGVFNVDILGNLRVLGGK